MVRKKRTLIGKLTIADKRRAKRLKRDFDKAITNIKKAPTLKQKLRLKKNILRKVDIFQKSLPTKKR